MTDTIETAGEFFELDRGRVLAHRAAAQDLAAPAAEPLGCRVLGIGLQDTPAGAGLAGIGVRTARSVPPPAALLGEGGPLVVVMAARGAPHLVERSQLPLLRAALRPVAEREAAEIDEVAQAMRAIAGGAAISRPALSEALNGRVADSLRAWCDRCAARHVREELFRAATLHAELEVAPDSGPPTLFRPGAPGAPEDPDPERARLELARRYVHLTGVARPADLAAWLGRTPGEIRPTWAQLAGELTACTVAGARRWALTADLASLSGAPRPRGAKLLPPGDPYLLGDRALVVPERDRQRELWRAQSSPGAILVDGEVAGTWRQRRRGDQLQVTLHPFGALGASALRALEREGEAVAALRGAATASVTVD